MVAGASAQRIGERPSLHLQADRYVWTTGVDGQTRQYRNLASSPARPGPVYLWLTVRGDEAALQWLRDDVRGAIPVYIFWMRRSLDGFYNDPADVVGLSVGNKDSVSLLSAQLAQEGTFSWRIWSGKTFARPGTWRVRVVDGWGGYLMCPTESDPTSECDLELEVAE
jgi:hypothetical protein